MRKPDNLITQRRYNINQIIKTTTIFFATEDFTYHIRCSLVGMLIAFLAGQKPGSAFLAVF